MFTSLLPPPSSASPERDLPPRARFEHLLAVAAQTQTLQRLVLSRPHGGEPDLQRLIVRPVAIKGQAHLQFVHRHTTKDITKNLPVDEAIALLCSQIGRIFQSALLVTSSEEVQLTVKDKGGRDKSLLRVHRTATASSNAALADGEMPASAVPPSDEAVLAHNRSKKRLLNIHKPWWQDLGVAGHGGQLLPTMASKWKQINRFVEIFSAAMADTPLMAAEKVRAIDFGCGKGYLTFALHEWLRGQGKQADILGVELRQPLVDLCNASARRHHLDGLRFDAGDVREYEPDPVDVMIALHACDIATDYALHLGLRAGARIILCSPCCHKELRPQMRSPAVLKPLLQHGIHLGQEAEMVTDGLRALLLDAHGFDTQVFEYVSLEHTNKNKMILAVRRSRPDAPGYRERVLTQIEALKAFYGIRTQTLEQLLAPTDNAA